MNNAVNKKLKMLNSRALNEESDQQYLDHYYVYTNGDTKKSTKIKRNLKLLLEHIAVLGIKTEVEVRIHELGFGDTKEARTLVQYELCKGTVEDCVNKLKDYLLTPNEVINRIILDMIEMSEYCDMNTACITGLFDTHGICGTTFANPMLEIDGVKANMMYEAMKSHAEAYKDNVNEKYKFNVGSNIIVPSGSGGGTILNSKGQKT